MNKGSKIRLSIKELEDISERDFFISKKIITQKIFEQLSLLAEQTKADKIFDGVSFPEGTDITTGKISKGENYLGFPFVMLDFPRLFSNEKTFAVRTMIWWGNFCSNTLLLSGEPLESRRAVLLKRSPLLKKKDFSICMHESPWHHHFESDNFFPVKKLTMLEMEKMIYESAFFKIAKKIPANEVNRLVSFSIKNFSVFAELLQPG